MSSVAGTSGPLSASAIVAPVLSGSHILRIEGYSASKGLGRNKYIASETFAAGGHSWCLRYYPASLSFRGYKSYDCIRIVLNLVQADVKEVKAIYTISLLDQAGNPVPSFSKTYSPGTFMADQCVVWGLEVEWSDLENSAYLKDDAFSVRCDITVVKKVSTKTIPVSEALRGAVKQER